MIITFTTEDGTRTGEIVESPRLPELNADGLHVVVRENGEFLGATAIDSSASLYEVQARVEQMRSNDPEHFSNGRSVDASLIVEGAYVWTHGGWNVVTYWQHRVDGSVKINDRWFSQGERILVHLNPELIRQFQQDVSRAVAQNALKGHMDGFSPLVQRKVEALATKYTSPKS